MEIWLDTIDENVITDAVKTGIISGVTTNPTILSKANNVLDTIKMLLDVQPGPVTIQVTSPNAENMIEEGIRIFELSSRMIVKIPINKNGLIAIQKLQEDNIPILGTAILYPSQVLLAQAQQIPYIAPYFSHMGSTEHAQATLKTMKEILCMSNSPTKILLASLREVDQIIYAALLGIEAATIKPDLYYKLLTDDPVVDTLLKQHSSDWQGAHKSL
ncbi:MAG: transaldolase family protein [Chlamydiales bacterium]|nr:transaldolase family protein [Chlamydiales bacterium]